MLLLTATSYHPNKTGLGWPDLSLKPKSVYNEIDTIYLGPRGKLKLPCVYYSPSPSISNSQILFYFRPLTTTNNSDKKLLWTITKMDRDSAL